jgi:radical SAM superfamily enzyme YgiQ (UPF0313 family)
VEAIEQFRGVLGAARAALRLVGEPVLQARLKRILRWTPERLLAEQERFSDAYQPISILPPDQYQAVVLQATYGCSWNRCTFCNFYQGRPFSIRSVEAFAEHVGAVKALLGRGEKLRQSIFLADGNALILSNKKLEPLIHCAKEAFPHRKLYGFVDVFAGERKSSQDWAELADWGLKRVYVGLETGHDALLRWMNKPGGGEDALAFIHTLKGAGVAVSTILMVGVGGTLFAGAHVEKSLDLIEQLPLDGEDIVYLSPFVEHPESIYARKARETETEPLSSSVLQEQFEALRIGVRAAHPEVRCTRYLLKEFIY